MKIITICGSNRFKNEILEITENLTLEGNLVLTPILLTKKSKDEYSKQDILMLEKIHKERIMISDAILVIDINNYIGDSTKSEIQFAKSLNKEIIYYSDLKNIQ